MSKKEFIKDFSGISKDPKVQKELEERFHFFKLKTKEEQLAIVRRNFKDTQCE